MLTARSVTLFRNCALVLKLNSFADVVLTLTVTQPMASPECTSWTTLPMICPYECESFRASANGRLWVTFGLSFRHCASLAEFSAFLYSALAMFKVRYSVRSLLAMHNPTRPMPLRKLMPLGGRDIRAAAATRFSVGRGIHLVESGGPIWVRRRRKARN
jgi:hypothetical protein